jgi:site-specific recombinase XerC
LDQFTRRYSNPNTAAEYRRRLTHLFRWTGRRHPSQLTDADLLEWCTSGNPANNTVYQHTSQVSTFLRWCVREGVIDRNPAEHLRDPDSPLRTFRRTFGKAQSKNPGRWLTHDDAYGQLVAVCQDGTIVGVRDEVILRLGLAGMRLVEIGGLRVVDVERRPTITWTGKGRKPRKTTAGERLVDALDRWLGVRRRRAECTADLPPGVRRRPPGRAPPHRLAQRSSGPEPLRHCHPASGAGRPGSRRPTRPETHGRRHPPPGHDRRGCPPVRPTRHPGVLGHSDPATTMKSYLEPMETTVLDRAAGFLD